MAFWLLSDTTWIFELFISYNEDEVAGKSYHSSLLSPGTASK